VGAASCREIEAGSLSHNKKNLIAGKEAPNAIKRMEF
jgi:hypothetical protein